MSEHKYIYVVVCNDLSNTQKAVQSSHAILESTRKYISNDCEHPSVIILIVKNETRLLKLADELDLCHVTFREPDIDNQMTAIATRPLVGDERDYFKKYQLML